MERNPLFQQTRLRLGGWYALVMGSILGLSGLGVYHVVGHAYHKTIDEGLKSVADALHQSIEPAWQQPGHLQQLAKELSLEICINQTNCFNKTAAMKHSIAQAAAPVNYYMRLLDGSGKPIATAGINLEQLPITSPAQGWQNLTDRSNSRYRQITLQCF